MPPTAPPTAPPVAPSAPAAPPVREDFDTLLGSQGGWGAPVEAEPRAAAPVLLPEQPAALRTPVETPAPVEAPARTRPALLMLPVVIGALAASSPWWAQGSTALVGVHLALWLLTVIATVVVLPLARRWPLVVPVLAGVVVALIAGYLANWSAVEPRSYFATHRPLFLELAEEIDAAGTDGAVPVPPLSRPIAPQALRVVGSVSDFPAVLVAQPGARDAAGYVYLAADPPPDFTVDLGGRQVSLFEGLYLGDGWWWI